MSDCKRTPMDVNRCRCQNDGKVDELGLVGLVVLIGAIVTILFGLFDIFGFGFGIAFFGAYGIAFWNLIWGIVAVVLAVGMLTTLGFLPNIKFKVSDNWVWMIVFGLVIFIPTGNWGGVIIILAAILKALNVNMKSK